MKIRTISREEAKLILDEYVGLGAIPQDRFLTLDTDYANIRKKLLEIETNSLNRDFYKRDLHFAMNLYVFLNKMEGFNTTVAGNYGFWRYICLCVVPDIIERRHKFATEYYYQKNTRMYVPAMWWYIHMSYQNDYYITYSALEKLNTDYIMQIVERTGRIGFYLEVTREIMRVITMLPTTVINKKVRDSNLFRRVLIQNTAKINNYNLTVEGKTREYVASLFRACKVEVKDYE